MKEFKKTVNLLKYLLMKKLKKLTKSLDVFGEELSLNLNGRPKY